MGRRVLTWLEGEVGYGGVAGMQIERGNHRAVWLVREADGCVRTVGLLRSVDWLAAQGIGRVGDRTVQELGELDVEGEFQVVAIEACPEIEAGPGRVVTAVYRNSVGRVYHLGVSGESEPLGVTRQHPFWSADRGDWVPAGKLRRGEQLLVAGGTAEVGNWDYASEEAVYNIEVDGDHCYRVGEQGVLVHNASAGLPSPCPEVPAYDGGKTTGVLIYPDGTQETIISGYDGASSGVNGIPRMNGNIKSHVEAHVAVIMRRRCLATATLCINRVPCPTKDKRSLGCFDALPYMLPQGSVLRVIGPDGFDMPFAGLHDAPGTNITGL